MVISGDDDQNGNRYDNDQNGDQTNGYQNDDEDETDHTPGLASSGKQNKYLYSYFSWYMLS